RRPPLSPTHARARLDQAPAPRPRSTPSLPDALPIYVQNLTDVGYMDYSVLNDYIADGAEVQEGQSDIGITTEGTLAAGEDVTFKDRKSTRLNSSHVSSSYAVFCLAKDTCCSA